MDKRCSAQVYGGTFVGHRCQRAAKVEREGRPYCGTHDPVAQDTKRKARHKKWDEQWKAAAEASTKTANRQRLIDELCGHIPTDELPQYELVKKTEGTSKWIDS